LESSVKTTSVASVKTALKPTTTTVRTTTLGKGRTVPNENPKTGYLSTTEANPLIGTNSGNLDNEGGDDIDDPTSLVTNSTVDKPQCKTVQCFPIPSKETCTVTPVTDCELLVLLGSIADCCPFHKCKSPDGDAIQFGRSLRKYVANQIMVLTPYHIS